MKVLGHELSMLREEEDGTVYVYTAREDLEKFEYKILQRLTIYDKLLGLVDEILENEPYPFYVTKIEVPALAYIIRDGIYKERGISKNKARQLSRFIKALFTNLHAHYSKEVETYG